MSYMLDAAALECTNAPNVMFAPCSFMIKKESLQLLKLDSVHSHHMLTVPKQSSPTLVYSLVASNLILLGSASLLLSPA
jgi:hypothetical protein